MKKDHRRHKVIIIAEDDPDDRMLIREALTEANITGDLRFVNDGEALMDLLAQDDAASMTQSVKPELILLDLNMPRKDGWQVLREIKANTELCYIPVVILTTSNQQEDVQRSYELGGSGFITKPGSYGELVQALRNMHQYWFQTVRLPS